jgi:hypothetical protein
MAAIEEILADSNSEVKFFGVGCSEVKVSNPIYVVVFGMTLSSVRLLTPK